MNVCDWFVDNKLLVANVCDWFVDNKLLVANVCDWFVDNKLLVHFGEVIIKFIFSFSVGIKT